MLELNDARALKLHEVAIQAVERAYDHGPVVRTKEFVRLARDYHSEVYPSGIAKHKTEVIRMLKFLMENHLIMESWFLTREDEGYILLDQENEDTLQR